VVDPAVLLKECSANMKSIEGFHFVFEVHNPSNYKPSSGLEIRRITGDINAKGDMEATVDVTQSGIPLEIGFIVVGDTQYIRVGQVWQPIPVDDSPIGNVNLSAGTIRILDRIMEAKYEGREKKAGASTYHISGMVAAAEVAAIAGSAATTGTFPADIWIGVSDKLIYEVDIEGPAGHNDPEGIWRSIILSNQDEPVDVVAPQ
jgi:hypothetical protein